MGAMASSLRLLQAGLAAGRAGARLPQPPAPMPARSWAGRWNGWAPPISSSARCWRRGPTLSASRWPRRWSICRTVCRLFPNPQARAEIARAFGKPVEELFSSFGAPLAAASIAQVHRAQTSDTPPVRVAVKILRPGMCASDFARDLEALALFARMAERFSAEARRLRLIAVVATLAESVALELDLRMEAAAASELYERTRGEERVPRAACGLGPHRASVLTSEWIDGISVRDAAAIAAAGHDPRAVAVMVMRNFLTQALRDGFFHADMHPGNLFIDAEGRLAAVDFGIMGRLDAGMRRFMAGTLAGFLRRDYRAVAAAAL